MNRRHHQRHNTSYKPPFRLKNRRVSTIITPREKRGKSADEKKIEAKIHDVVKTAHESSESVSERMFGIRGKQLNHALHKCKNGMLQGDLRRMSVIG
jgi:hypothetical protein